MRNDSRVMEQREFQTRKVRAQRILNPLKKSGTKNQKAPNDEQPIRRPEFGGSLCPWHEAFGYTHACLCQQREALGYLHVLRLSFFAQDSTKGERKAMPSRA
jgi:hypothetical protein